MRKLLILPGWYQDENGDWYNQFDWYQDENGEYYYDDQVSGLPSRGKGALAFDTDNLQS